jgi:Xaa-Pro aminopeptidase
VHVQALPLAQHLAAGQPGLEGHEPRYLVPGSREPLAEGAVVTIEPGVYTPGEGGVRSEDDVVCRAGGAEVLTSYDRSLRIV